MPIRIRWLIASPMTALSLTITACAGPGGTGHNDPPPPVVMPAICTKDGPIVFTLSGRQDSPAPVLTGTMRAAATSAVNSGSAIGLVTVDGDPRLVAASAFSDPAAGNGDALASDKTNYLNQLEDSVTGLRATAPHADVLKALDVAGRAIRAACPYGGTVYLEDSGLSETGPMDFRQSGLLGARPGEVVALLAAKHELPHLKGISVVLAGIGDTAAPQAPLSVSQQDNVIAIWLAIAKAGGATSVRVDPAPLSGPAPAHAPAVLLVPVPGGGTITISLPDKLLFRVNSATLVPTADAALKPLIEQARRQHLEVSITGYASPEGSATYNLALSKRRAIAVRDRLITLGLAAGQITRVTGVGSAGQPPNSCLLKGHPDEAECAPLRRVVVTLSPARASH